MTYAFSNAPSAAHSGIRESFSAVVARVVSTVGASMARRRARKSYHAMLQDDELLRDVGISREDVKRALAECGY